MLDFAIHCLNFSGEAHLLTSHKDSRQLASPPPPVAMSVSMVLELEELALKAELLSLAVGNIEGVVNSKYQVTLPARGLIVKSNVE